METTELFNFKFVDRNKERIILNNFLTYNADYVLWIRGNRGLGKTKFFKHILQENCNYILCYIDINSNQTTIDIISEFIIEIQKVSDINFLDYVKKLYKQFYNRVYEKTKNITSEIFPKISNVISIILDTGYYAVTYSDENKNPSDIIYEYLKNILKKHSLCLCIDNFSRCNIETADFFIQILKRLIHETNYRACISHLCIPER